MQGYCTSCRSLCTVVARDFGIGAYEYWGAHGVDSQIEAVSDCCDAPATDAHGRIIELSDLEKDQEEWDYGT